MKDVNYKRLRNLPKYDLGLPTISGGYQRNLDNVPVGYYTKQATPITGSELESSIIDSVAGAGSIAQNIISQQKALKVFSNSMADYAANNLSNVVADEAFDETAKASGKIAGSTAYEAAKNNAREAAGKVFGAAAKGAAVIGGIQGALGLMQKPTTLTSADLEQASSQQTQYINGVAFNTYGGFDQQGADKLVNSQRNAAVINGVMNGAKVGNAVGSFLPGIGNIVATGAGAILGGIKGLFNRHKLKDAYNEAKYNWGAAATNYNQQSESEAASQGLRNQYYATHADKGLSVNTKNPNALVQGGEPILKYKNGRIVEAGMFPITPQTPERVDNIPVRLDKGDAKHGVIGNLRDPETGERLAVEARPWVQAYNSQDPELKALGEANLNQIMAKQEQLQQMKKMKQYHLGKCLPRFDKGSFPWQIWGPAAANSAIALKGYFDAKKSPVEAYNTYIPNRNAQQSLAMMPTTVNVNPQLQELNNQVRQSHYLIDQLPISAGAKMAMRSKVFSDQMKNRSDIYASKEALENQYKTDKAKFLWEAGDRDATREQTSLANYYDQLYKGNAARRKEMWTRLKDVSSYGNTFAENMLNHDMFKQSLATYLQDQERKDIKAKKGGK